jgi:predicted phosphodiesterase
MQVAVISDLHLGPGGPTDLFGHDDTDFLRFLRFLENNFERVVLLGDIWETLTGTSYGRPGVELVRAQRQHREIARRFSGPKYDYVHGNHDIVAATQGAPEELTLEADGVRLLFTHGHQNDPIVRSARWLSEMGVWLGGWIRRLGSTPLYQLGRRLDSMRSGNAHEAGRQFQSWAVSVAKLRNADVVVTGHTHVAARAEHGDRLFLNCGSCAEGHVSFSSLDTRTGRYSVHDSW